MTIQNYISDYALTLTAFYNWWILKNKENPNSFPLDISDKDIWDSMFEAFKSLDLK